MLSKNFNSPSKNCRNQYSVLKQSTDTNVNSILSTLEYGGSRNLA
uniref:Uncharacterized protein n=1 Tax=Nelumbo nucifera TaxID=4432 RepID=A0A822YY35_NELNU|nr:TPA_asm: hypothetical protein HUJ06_008223 [Nelumbo nucifera]